MATGYYTGSGTAYTGDVYRNNGNYDNGYPYELANGAMGQVFGSGPNGGADGTSLVYGYDTDKYSSPALAWLDNMPGNRWGSGSGGLSALVTQLGLDPNQVVAAAQKAESNGTFDSAWNSGPQSALQRIVAADPSLGTPQVQALLNNQQFKDASTAAQQQSSNSYDAVHPAQSMHADDYYTMAAGIGSILGAGYLGGAFGGALGEGAGAGTAAGWTSGYDLAGDAGLQGLEGASAAGTGGLSEFGGAPSIAADTGSTAAGNGAAITGDSMGGTAPGVLDGGAGAGYGSGFNSSYDQLMNSLAPTNTPLASAGTGPINSSSLVGGTSGGVVTPQGAINSGLFNVSGGNVGGLGSSLGGGVGSTGGSGSIGGMLQSYATNPQNYLSTALNYFNNQSLSKNLTNAANTAADKANTANNPEAIGAYNTAMDYVNNPSKYINNQGAPIAAQIMQGVPAAIAKSGNWGNVVANAGTNIAGALSQNYNGFLGNLFGQTGLGQSSAGAGNIYGQLAGQSALASASGTAGLGSLLGNTLSSYAKSNNSSSGSGGLSNPFNVSYS